MGLYVPVYAQAPLSNQAALTNQRPPNNVAQDAVSVPEPRWSDPNSLPPLEPRVQGRLPRELILPPPSDQAVSNARRFVEAEINPELPLPLALGRPKILQLSEAPLRIYTPDEEIATAELLDRESGRELAVTGLKVGSTTLTLWFRDANAESGQSVVSYLIQVFADPLLTRSIDDLERDLNERFPDSFVELDDLDGRMVVRGQARDSIEMAQILQILTGARGVQPGIQRTAQSNTVGSVFNFAGNDSLADEEIAADNRSLIDPVLLARAGIVNLMRVPGEQQVMLRVTVAEVNRTAARSIGLNFTALNDSTLLRNTTGNVTGNLLAVLDRGQVTLRIEALRKLSLSRTLAEPNLVAINGRPANFQAGGQFPVPVIASGGIANNLQGVQFVPFGVQLQFVPLIQDRDVIRLQVQANVSTRDEALGANIGGGAGGGGTAVPGLNSRNFSTTVELRSGQTLAVAGLLQTNFGASSDRVPGWGDLPIIGWTGGVNRTSAAEQELVILVTPELVAPVDACGIPGLPGDNVYEPTDVEFFIANRLESRRSRDFRSPARTDYNKLRMPDKCCPDRFLVGSAGPTDRCCNQPMPVVHQALPQHNPSVPSAVEFTPIQDEEVTP
jgi:pilus assembly protein CpaC